MILKKQTAALLSCFAALCMLIIGCSKSSPTAEEPTTEPVAAQEPAEESALPPPETLEELVLRYADVYSALTDAQRKTLIKAWQGNDFRYGYPVEMLQVYSSLVGIDAAAVLYYWNAQCCFDYVQENYTGNADYLAELEGMLSDSTARLLTLWSGERSREELDVGLVDTMSDLYADLNGTPETPISMKDISLLMELLSEYGPARGEADAEAFFRMVDGA